LAGTKHQPILKGILGLLSQKNLGNWRNSFKKGGFGVNYWKSPRLSLTFHKKT
jgi:hypothetical protein